MEREPPILPEHPSLLPVFSGVRVARSLVFICSVLLIIVCPFVHFLLIIVLSVHFPYTASDYHFVISKLSLLMITRRHMAKRNEIPMTDYWRYILHKHITTQMGYYFLKIIPSKLLQGWRVSSKRYKSIIATWMGCHHPWCLHFFKCHSIVLHQRISWGAFYLRRKLEYPVKTKQPPPVASHWQTSSHKVVSIISSLRRISDYLSHNPVLFPPFLTYQWIVTGVTRLVPHVGQELPILPKHMSSSPIISEVRVARSLVFCV